MKLYHTQTRKDYDALMSELESKGVKWSNGKRLKRVPQTGVGIVDYNRPEPKVLLSNESKFVDAWLHPELIEVSDD